MNIEPGLERCLSFINCQLHPASAVVIHPVETIGWRAVTISRQSGAGGHAVAEALAECLQARGMGDPGAWTVFDRNLVEKVLEEHHLPNSMVRFMPEDRVSTIDDVMEELCGLHPPYFTLVNKTAETILRLAKLGNAILLGRGGNVVTRKLGCVFHVRLVGSLQKRADYIQQCRGISKPKALELIRHDDLGRQRYLKRYYHSNIDDPLLYHMVVNTDLTSHKLVAKTIAETMFLSRPPA